MSVSNTSKSTTYVGDGVQTIYPIQFDFLDNSQVKVTLRDVSVSPALEVVQVAGVGYTFVGLSPSSDIQFFSAPSSSYEIVVERATPRIQPYEFTNNGTNFPATYEKALDNLSQQIQEVEAGVGAGGSASLLATITSQALADGDTITYDNTVSRAMVRVQGDGAPVVLDATTPVQAGYVDGQEILVIGGSDDEPLTIPDGGNVILNGDATLYLYDTLHLVWWSSVSKWIEIARSL